MLQASGVAQLSIDGAVGSPVRPRATADRKALVVGGARGIGAGIANRLMNHGATVAVADLDVDGHDLARSPAALMELDVRDAGRVDEVVSATSEEMGGLDVVVNAAGQWAPTPLAMAIDPALEAFRELLEVNLVGSFLVGRSAIPHLRVAGGDLILVSTDHVTTCGWPAAVDHREAEGCPWAGRRPRRPGGGVGMDSYDASKWALNGLAQAWATELRGTDVRVNVLCPGATDTRMLRSSFPSPSAEMVRNWLSPDDVGLVVEQLLSEGMDGRTGENIGVWPGHALSLPEAVRART